MAESLKHILDEPSRTQNVNVTVNEFEEYTFPSNITGIDKVKITIYVNNNDPGCEYYFYVNRNGVEIHNDYLYNPAFVGYGLEVELDEFINDDEDNPIFSPGDRLKVIVNEDGNNRSSRITGGLIEYEYEGASLRNYLKLDDQKLCKSVDYEAVTVDLANLLEGQIYYIDQADYDRVMIENNLFPPVPASNGKLRILLPQAMQYRADTTYGIGTYVLYDPEGADVGIIDRRYYHFYRRVKYGPAGIPPDDKDTYYWHECPDLDPGITFYRPSGKGYLYIP